MHAVFVLPRFFPYRGGYENSMLAIAKCLLSRGHRVTVFTTTADDLESLWLPGYKTFPAGDTNLDGITLRRFPVSYNRLARRLSRFAGLIPYWRLKAQFWRPSFHVPGLREALHSINADLFHVGPLPYNSLMYAGIEAAEHRRVPVIATPCVHLGESADSEVAEQYIQPHQVALLKHCDRVLCMTVTELERLSALGVPRENLTVTGHGFELTTATGGNGDRIRRQYGIDGPVVLHLGMKAYDKGSVTLVEAMKLLWECRFNAWLVMAGPSLRAFDDYIAQNSACKRLINLPPFDDADKRDLLAAADIVAQPSRVESLGLVLLEAWANAKPVIAADIAVSRQLVEQSGGGRVVPFGDSGQLANTLAGMLNNAESRRRMGSQARLTALEYEGSKMWVRNAEQFEAVVKP